MTLFANPEETRQTIRCDEHAVDGWASRILTLEWACEVCAQDHPEFSS